MVILLNFFRRLGRQIRQTNVLPVLLLTGLMIGIGVLAFMRFEGWSALDALYTTIITITTVGYGDLSPQTRNGRIFAIFFTFVAIGVGGYAISSFAAYLIESRIEKRIKFLRKRRMKRIENLSDHYILCGADLVGTRIAEEFFQAKVPFVVIDHDEAKLKNTLLFSHPDYFEQKIKSLMDFVEVDLSDYEDRSVAELGELLETPYLLDDPTDDAVLMRAGIARAKGLIAAMPDERDNLAIVIGARALGNRFENNDLVIMARVEDSQYIRKLYLSGADFVRIPAIMSGLEMAIHMMHPEIGRWWYTLTGADKAKTANISQTAVRDRPDWVGKTVTALHREVNVMVLAVKRDEKFLTPPPADLTLSSDDILITLAEPSAK